MKEGGTKQTLEIHSRACYQYNQLQEDDENGEKDGEDGEDSIQKKNQQQLLKKRTKKSKNKKKSSDQIKKSDMMRDLKFYQVCFLSFFGLVFKNV